MKDSLNTSVRAGMPQSGESAALLNDPDAAEAIEGYRAALAAGERPDRQVVLARFPALREPLIECLDALDLLAAAAPVLRDDDSDPKALALHLTLGDFQIV